LRPVCHEKTRRFYAAKVIRKSRVHQQRFEDGLTDAPRGSPRHGVPECLSGRPYDGHVEHRLVVFAMLTGQLKWIKRVQAQLCEQIHIGESAVPAFLSRPARDFLTRLITVSPADRAKVDDALFHRGRSAASQD
jgi:serine/threonine protein kinase